MRNAAIDEVAVPTVADVHERIDELHDVVCRIAARSDEMATIVVALLAQHGDPTHVDVHRAAELRGCSVSTIRRMIANEELTLDVVPGTRESGIPIEQIYARWIPIAAARRAIQKMREEARLPLPRSSRRRATGTAESRPIQRNRKTRA